MITEKYIKRLQEKKEHLQEREFNKIKNAPCAAYETVYKKPCPHKRGSEPSHKQRKWKNILVDEHLKNKWLNDLNNIKEIEIRSSCEGHDKDWVSFVIFRMLDEKIEKNKKKINKIVYNLNRSDKITKCASPIGSMGRPRIVVAAPIWYGHDKWEEWWNNLTNIIRKAVI